MCIRDRFQSVIGMVLMIGLTFVQQLGVCVYGASWYLLPSMFMALVFTGILNSYFTKTQAEMIRLESITRSPILGFFSETLNGLTTIRTFNMEDVFMQQHFQNLNENIKNQISNVGLTRWFSLRVNLLSIFFIILPALGLTLLYSDLSASLAGLLLTYCFALDSSLISLITNMNSLDNRLVSFERCHAFTVLPSERAYKTEKQVNNYREDYWPENGIVEFKNYSARYRPKLPFVLRNLKFQIKDGEKIGVVGRTGAGKSSFILSLMRLIEGDSGTINISNVDISQLGLYDLRRKITVIPQESYIFNGTLRVNIDPLGNYKDDEILDAFVRLKVKNEFDLRGGLDMMIQEGGDSLSEGEKQIISITRAMLKKNRIVLLDEATSSIDISTEKRIEHVIQNVFKEHTVITVAHRINTIIHSDRVLVLSQGEVVEFDSPDHLLKNHESYFYKIWKEFQNNEEIVIQIRDQQHLYNLEVFDQLSSILVSKRVKSFTNL
eukprot:TRINITY_DN937_c0_g2_i5.p1 TRINITY_DN937_c0_g2~~TRINITY_DN937_c0_g2_i5.p1  ORF type:complete len:493 (-),score=62.67 TRINITY_DN937_c0_g2_i5:129-1607(-)